MKTYEQVDTYMQQIGLKYVKSSNEFVAGLAIRTNKDYTQKVAAELNSRAQHSNSSNMVFIKLKTKPLTAQFIFLRLLTAVFSDISAI